jgi:hypothetical protein
MKWQGVAEQLAAFATLPEDLTRAATPEVADATTDAASSMKAQYPSRTGNLRNGVHTALRREPTRVVGVVVNDSPHAAVYEYGSQARHTAIGANRGSMPAHPVFVPTMLRERRALFAGPIPEVLEDEGLKVVGRA